MKLAGLALLCCGCAAAPIPAMDNDPAGRELAIDVTENKDADYAAALAIAKDHGTRSVDLSLDWTGLENADGLDMTWPEIANAYYPNESIRVRLIFRPVNTNHLTLPPDLAGRKLSDPVVIERFSKALAATHAAMPDTTIESVMIGNEIDGWLGADAERWSEWDTFYKAARSKEKSLWGEAMPVGTIAMLSSCWDPAMRKRIQDAMTTSDIISLTYYPLTDGFQVLPPSSPKKHFAEAAAWFPGKPIELVECGYPSSPTCGSSQDMQAEFVRACFEAWDEQKDRIRLVSFAWLNDIDPNQAIAYQDTYGMRGVDGAEEFSAFLASLGLRTWGDDARDKPALAALKHEAQARGLAK